ncbi:hypothetical protein GCM10011608_09520 [Micromonospora sonchi]|uniref:Uncharacterized protein n=1 Tax=Micromonospora sonchi TaxID=1763543 RepID=A0A917TMY2_9ACTN|nr:hypothetical protein [Micromonospora sonchi]GGM26847.1 hypothetical protein GCM10011608_09520 [Micromonospora sonchi]
MNVTRLADDTTLVESLRLAVPLHLADLLARPAADRDVTARWWAADAARAVGERGDLLQFVDANRNGAKRTRVANTFDQMARGLAALVVMHEPGVDVAGLHWCLRDKCDRCRPARPQPAVTLADINAQLEALDDDYRRLAGLPPYTPPPVEPSPPTPLPAPRRPVTVVNLPEVA